GLCGADNRRIAAAKVPLRRDAFAQLDPFARGVAVPQIRIRGPGHPRTWSLNPGPSPLDTKPNYTAAGRYAVHRLRQRLGSRALEADQRERRSNREIWSSASLAKDRIHSARHARCNNPNRSAAHSGQAARERWTWIATVNSECMFLTTTQHLWHFREAYEQVARLTDYQQVHAQRPNSVSGARGVQPSLRLDRP